MTDLQTGVSKYIKELFGHHEMILDNESVPENLSSSYPKQLDEFMKNSLPEQKNIIKQSTIKGWNYCKNV